MPAEREVHFFEGKLIAFNPALNQKGFIFHPFNREENQPLILVDQDFDETSRAIDLPIQPSRHSWQIQDYAVYSSQVNEAVSYIRQGLINKLVLSRIVPADGLTSAQASEAFHGLCSRYPDAFVYLFSGGAHLRWMGASPETLVHFSNHRGYTVSLAGTLPAEEDLIWSDKERDEQQIVTDYIVKELNNAGAEDISLGEPFEAFAGNLIHIKTEIRFTVPQHVQPMSIVNALHPTPAVCGSPRGKALQLITAIEQHKRLYYTGFLGPWSIDGVRHLFVNLRCMEFTNQQSLLYVGGGITAYSQAKREWDETTWKAETLSWLFKAK
jgi:isochorismate synthase